MSSDRATDPLVASEDAGAVTAPEWRAPMPTDTSVDAGTLRPNAEPEATGAPSPEPPTAVIVGPSVYMPVARTRAAPAGAPGLVRALVSIGLFVVGLGAGIAGFVALNAPPSTASVPALETGPEPAIAHQVATSLVSNDVSVLADKLAPADLSTLAQALQPLVDITGVTYLGDVHEPDRDLAGYIVRGTDDSGQKMIVGVVLDVAGGQIVGINQ